MKFADQLDAALDACGFECLIDRYGIFGGEDWKRRLGNLISEADTVVFVLSPSSARSEICDWEVEEAARLNKRILPVNCRPLEGVSPPPRLRDLNYMFFYEEPKVPGSGFGTGLARLIAALNTDLDWLREHNRYLQRAMEWDKGGRAANRLLSGNDILEAKAWVARRPKGAPEPTALHLDFIRASEEEADARLSEQRKQLEAMAAAQAERETALHDREEAFKRRARVTRIIRTVAEQLLKGATSIVFKLQSQMDSDTKKQVFSLFEKVAKLGHRRAMFNVGVLYEGGHGVPQDYAKARKWYEKAAHKDSAAAMINIGRLYYFGRGVPQDYGKAREWYEKAAMTSLGVLYERGRGVPQDYAKAREWYEKVAVKGHVNVKVALERLSIREASTTGRYAEALQLQEAIAAKTEAEETKRDGKPGEQTATELHQVAWYALFAKEFTKALTASDRAYALIPDRLLIETNRAHALMFMESGEEAKALYLAYKGKPLSAQDNRLWERVIVEDFTELRKAGLTHPMMADIEKELGVAR